MLLNRLYYGLKPCLPWRLRLALRRLSARRRWRIHRHDWPIHPDAVEVPANWPGWPDGKKFAFVLTHDVEGPEGVAKCRDLMQQELKLGFRSSFNLVPEGSYIVPSELRAELTGNGFEVGVHDLYHDGKLYWSRRAFNENAGRINRYLKEWNAEGFRAAFMLHDLKWLHKLQLRYDASTFDHDPFEPQPEGVHTIFPFWVPGKTGGGYVELPYTLPQDYLLYVVLRETTTDIWKRKLDWVAAHGGMVLFDVHPDYINFGDAPCAAHEFPLRYYTDLLTYVSTRYAGQYWQALPREVAAFAERARPVHVRTSHQRVCMITFSSYETDNRVMRYAESLAERGDTVDILALKRAPSLPDTETIRGVSLHRIQNRFSKGQEQRGAYLFPILWFWLKSSAWLTFQHLFRRRYDFIHVHNVPDFMVFTAWFPKLTGAKVILDIHDIVPEFYASKFHLKPDSVGVRVLKFVERASAWFADHVIISNHLWHKTITARSVAAAKCTAFINNVNQKIYFERPRARHDGKTVIVFPGGLQWHQGLDIAIRAFALIKDKIPNAEFQIYGDGNMKSQLEALTQELGLADRVRFFKPLPVSEIAQVMANADLGVVPKRSDSFGNEAYSTKIMEFMSLGVPVVVSNTKIDRYYFDDTMVRFFESGNHEALAAAMLEVLNDGALRARMVARARQYAQENSWDVRKVEYLKLVDSLCSPEP